jgi:cyclopropane fatty-acyl-phospholipid synthase-like methyltransferase
MKIFDPRNILKIAFFYRTLQSLGKHARKEFAETYIKAKNGDKVLDIGCGPGDILEYLPNVQYSGFDLEERYIEAAKKKFGDRGSFFCERVTNAKISDPGTYDIVIVSGVIHHLSDEETRDLFKLAKHALKPGGRFISLDNVFIENQAIISKILVSLDRGEFVRKPEKYNNLASEFFTLVNSYIRNDLLRPIPYSHFIMECSD